MARDLKGKSLLVIDRDSGFLRQAKGLLSDLGAQVHLAHSLEDALSLLSVTPVELVFFEAQLPFSGAELKLNYQTLNRAARFFALVDKSGKGSEAAQGVDGFLVKPLSIVEVLKKTAPNESAQHLPVSRLDPLTELLRPYLIFRSALMRRRLQMLPQMAASDHGVLITGETGTGKEMAAHAIHDLSRYKNGPFIAVNCGAIPETLIEGELFGHEKGAFTGAGNLHKGKFELAQEGTLFLDEIGEMPLLLQARLLRVLEERAVYRIGGEKPIPVDLRVLAATRVDLAKAVENGLFREDLYYRLNILPLHLPALRERPEDIALLAWYFLERAFLEAKRQPPFPSLTEASISILSAQVWRGNVRELRNLMTRLAVLLPPSIGYIEPKHLLAYFPEALNTEPRNERPALNGVIELSPQLTEAPKEGILIPWGTRLDEAEGLILQAVLDQVGGNRSEAARLLGISQRTIRRRLNEI
ncbi:MAG: hypothetical protein A2527_05290 [Candidatus Lambdaproteobacteria bacterium RIFOXYD2_FULL_50_16]|uniref:Sigma-54-dependent Fis family transcriptional regulator n=1 Tax=Candidatus Lambdaproteobacteria bacterium RIFOXYD2_FULL_50_16 TaxID=1817772 RepID=A0A1F6G905_9PROT|nr:MAG: hypothetical protein A2527_05290 [Candidatus Lambdaproteobacteria bacterium RIFOXYD2_FULL_50_16]